MSSSSLDLQNGIDVGGDDALDRRYEVADNAARDLLITQQKIKVGRVILHTGDNQHYKLTTYPTPGSLTGVVWEAFGDGQANGGHTLQDEGVDLPQRSKIDFVGNGVTANDDAANDKTIVNIPINYQTASQVSSTPVGAVTATDVQTAISQLESLISSVNSTSKTYADIAARDADTANVANGESVFVTDASADATVTSGWAVYRWNGTSYDKLYDQDDLDIDLSVYLNTTTGGTINGPVKIQSDGTSLFKLLEFGLDGGRDWYLEQFGSGPGTHLRLRSKENKDFFFDLNTYIVRSHDGITEAFRVSPANNLVTVTGQFLVQKVGDTDIVINAQDNPSGSEKARLIFQKAGVSKYFWENEADSVADQFGIYSVPTGGYVFFIKPTGEIVSKNGFLAEGTRVSIENSAGDTTYHLEVTGSGRLRVYEGANLRGEWSSSGLDTRIVPQLQAVETISTNQALPVSISAYEFHNGMTLNANITELSISGGEPGQKVRIRMIQGATGGTLTLAPTWVKNTAYSVGNSVLFIDSTDGSVLYGKVYTCNTAHTSDNTGTYGNPQTDIANWDISYHIKGEVKPILSLNEGEFDFVNIEVLASSLYRLSMDY